LIYVLWLEMANRLRRIYDGSSRTRFWLALFGSVAAICATGMAGKALWPMVLNACLTHLQIVLIMAAVQASAVVKRQRTKWQATYVHSWLATLPLQPSAFTRAIALRAFSSALIVLIVVCVVALGASVLSHSGIAESLRLLGIYCVGGVMGSLLGWWFPQRTRRVDQIASTDAGAAGSAAQVVTPSLNVLSRWPIAQARVWNNPRTLVRTLLPVMLAIPMGVSANVAIAILILLGVSVHLVVLLRATAYVAGKSAAWLRPTPISLGRFTWAVMRRPLLQQVQWSVLASVMLIALGCAPATALRVAEFWLALVSVISSLAVSHAYESQTMKLKALFVVTALTTVETRMRHATLAPALLFSGWQLWQVART
jgi:hypothetical protein